MLVRSASVGRGRCDKADKIFSLNVAGVPGVKALLAKLTAGGSWLVGSGWRKIVWPGRETLSYATGKARLRL